MNRISHTFYPTRSLFCSLNISLLKCVTFGSPLFFAFVGSKKGNRNLLACHSFFLFSSSNKRKAGEKCEIATHKPLPNFFCYAHWNCGTEIRFGPSTQPVFILLYLLWQVKAVFLEMANCNFLQHCFSHHFVSAPTIVPLLRESILLQKASYALYYSKDHWVTSTFG